MLVTLAVDLYSRIMKGSLDKAKTVFRYPDP